MKPKFSLILPGIVMSIAAAAPIAVGFCGPYGGDVTSLIESQIVTLREQGQTGLTQALATLDEVEAKLTILSTQLNAATADTATAKTMSETLQQEREQLVVVRDAWRAAIDQIGGQRSCTVSRLYWHTDLEKAKAEAERTGRPILSLRMLGKLTDEYSCANSRFFRTSLYSNQEISEFLRNNYVLHWHSVRPVPRVTIDFGDGRKLERTLTGNSAHYVLASDGTPLDVLPGLYSPQEFLGWTSRLANYYQTFRSAPAADRARSLQVFHDAELATAMRRWDLDIQRVGGQQADVMAARINSAIDSARAAGETVPDNSPPPNARAAAARAVRKSVIEVPMLRFANLGGNWMERGMDDDLWQAVANLHRAEVKLDAASITLMRTEFPAAAQAGRRALTKSRVEDPILRVVRQFEEAINLDTVRNEYLLHRRIHEKFAASEAITGNIDTLNEWVYAELFLTPSSDPWLGLAPQDVYTALENNGQLTVANP